MLACWHAYDAYVSHKVFSFLRSIGFTELRPGHANKITGGLPLVKSPTPMLTLIGAYLVIVTVGLAFLKTRRQPSRAQEDPRWLKNLVQVQHCGSRHNIVPLLARGTSRCAHTEFSGTRTDVRTASQVHNVILIALSAWMAGSAVYWAFQYGYRFWGNGFKASETELGMTIYVFYLSKFYEFFDTVGCRRALLLGSIVTHAHVMTLMVYRPAVHHALEGQVRADIAVTRVPSCLHIVHMVRLLPCMHSSERASLSGYPPSC